MKVLVTGAAGFLGQNLMAVMPDTWDARCLHYRTALDLADADAVREFAAINESYDVVIALAGRVDIPGSLRSPDLDLRDNAFTVLNLMRFVRCRHLIYVSTGAVYEGQYGLADPTRVLAPSLPYASHKLLGEAYARAAAERWLTASRVTIVRFFGCYGPHEPTHKLYARLARTFVVDECKAFSCYGDGMNFVDAMWAPDAALALVALAEDRKARPDVWTVDLCRGEPMMVDDVVRIAGEVLLGGAPEVSYYGVASERNLFYGDPDTFRRELAWWPTLSLAEGFKAYRDHLKGAR